MVLYLKQSVRSMFWTTVRLEWPQRPKKVPKLAKNGGKKHKIAYYAAKCHFQVPKIPGLVA